jgi:hypothetical protein
MMVFHLELTLEAMSSEIVSNFRNITPQTVGCITEIKIRMSSPQQDLNPVSAFHVTSKLWTLALCWQSCLVIFN